MDEGEIEEVTGADSESEGCHTYEKKPVLLDKHIVVYQEILLCKHALLCEHVILNNIEYFVNRCYSTVWFKEPKVIISQAPRHPQKQKLGNILFRT